MQYRKNNVFVFPNHNQTWGLAVFEAMASGLPVIVSKTTGAAEVLSDHKTALIVPPKSPADIANAIEELMTKQDLCGMLSVNGRKFVEENISWEKYAVEMEKIFMQYNQG